MANGTRWEVFLSKCLPALINFQLKFKLTNGNSLHDVNLESFRSVFSLYDKRWFVVIDDGQASALFFHDDHRGNADHAVPKMTGSALC